MCGIVGAISARQIDQELIERMRDRLAHRGPDHAGVWLAADGRTCLGHRRLAIVDLNADANQPFISDDGRFVITFNGEIYNFRELRAELGSRGVQFRTRCDTEVLLEAYRCYGSQCLARLSGMFAFAIWDTVERRLFCARDRAGEKPFYYTMVGDSFVFGSEVKSLLLWPGFRREIHYPALIDYLTFGFVVDPKSIWEGCHKLAPGHWISVAMHPGERPQAGDPVAYWDMEFQPDHSVADWGLTIRETLRTACEEMAFADVPIGSFLSGGVDSSSVTAALSLSGCSVSAFTVGFEEQDYDERPWAREVAQLYGTPHVEKVVRATDVTQVFRKMLWHYDEPFNDYSYLPMFYLCREARKNITVALSGDGADEMFAGYLKYQRLAMREDVLRFVPRLVTRLMAAGATSFLPRSSPFRRKMLHYGLNAPTTLTDMLLLGFHATDLRAASRGPLKAALQHYTPIDAIRPLLAKAPPEKVGLVNAMRYLDLKLTLAGDILVKVDRASMAVSLEVRPVYLHRDMLALAQRIPSNKLADRNHTKEALKLALRPWLPNSVLDRRKMGFAMPLRNWIRDDSTHLFSRNDGDDPLNDLLDSTLLQDTLAAHRSGSRDLTSIIHSLLFLREWLGEWT